MELCRSADPPSSASQALHLQSSSHIWGCDFTNMKNPEITHAKRVPALPFTSYLSFRQSLVWFLKSTQIPLKFGAFWATKYGVDDFYLHFPYFVCIVLVILPVSFGYVYFSPFYGKPTQISFPETHLKFKTIEQTYPVASINNIQPWVQGLKTNKLLKCTGSIRQTTKFKEFLSIPKRTTILTSLQSCRDVLVEWDSCDFSMDTKGSVKTWSLFKSQAMTTS